MTESPAQRIRRNLAEIWRLRRALLQRALARLPDSGAVPHWLIRVRILNYLLARYVDCPDLRAVDPPACQPYADELAITDELGALPRTRGDIRAVLDRIAERNERTRGDLIVVEGRVLRIDLARLLDAILDAEGRQGGAGQN